MRSIKAAVCGLLLVAASSVSMAQSGGGCLAGRYTYFDADGNVVGSATMGCPAGQSYSWGEVTDEAVFSPGCLAAS
jgi:hypothetical protein